MRLACVSVASLLAAAGAAAAPFAIRLHIDASLRTNAVYHLACLGGSIGCSRDLFERFWKERLHESPEDCQTVDAWRRLLAKAVERAPEPRPSPFLINAIPFHPDDLRRSEVIAGLIERRPAAAIAQRAPGLNRTDATDLMTLIDRIERRLRPWWRAEGERWAKTRIRGVAERARRTNAMEALGQMARFLGSTPPSRDAYVHAIAPPDPDSQNARATAILNHLPIELIAAVGDPNAIVHGAVHELTHYLYDYMPADRHAALVNEFAASSETSVIGMYSYLHEALAISAQGLYNDRLESARSDRQVGREDEPDAKAAEQQDEGTGYKHPYIPALADVATPLVKAAVARDEQLAGGFSRSYIAGAAATLSSRRHELPFVFAQAVLVPTSTDSGFTDAFQRTLFPVGFVRLTDLAQAQAFPDTNLVQFSVYSDLGAVTDPSLTQLRDTRRGFAVASRRGRGGYHLLVAGRSAEDVLAVIEKLRGVDALAAPGLVAAID